MQFDFSHPCSDSSIQLRGLTTEMGTMPVSSRPKSILSLLVQKSYPAAGWLVCRKVSISPQRNLAFAGRLSRRSELCFSIPAIAVFEARYHMLLLCLFLRNMLLSASSYRHELAACARLCSEGTGDQQWRAGTEGVSSRLAYSFGFLLR